MSENQIKGEKLTFIDIFNSDVDGKKISKIIIPKLQRDYAQGRESENVTRIREEFLNALKNALISDKAIVLDFIYGSIDKNQSDEWEMTILDGQQRLTTLFLLHWYVLKKINHDTSFLSKFSYETRCSSRDFCKFLINFKPEFDKKLSDEIKNDNKFPYSWLDDPTISSMIVMLDSIKDTFSNDSDWDKIWQKLNDKAITFYFLAIDNMGLTDELYIKMNSRGKPLTSFENLKAKLEKYLQEDTIKEKLEKYLKKECNGDCVNYFINKFDGEWTDALWKRWRSKKQDQYNDEIDDYFIKYFRFICRVIYFENKDENEKYKNDPEGIENNLVLLEEYFSEDYDNIEILYKYFDILENMNEAFFNGFFSGTYEKGKIRTGKDELDLIETLINSAKFSLSNIIRLYGIVIYQLNHKTIPHEQFGRRYRIVNNLVKNSSYEIREEHMAAILEQTEYIMLNGEFNDDINSNFNTNQIEEEKIKIEWLKENPESAESLFKLEDHELLDGRMGVVGFEPERFDRFENLFKCDYDKIDCALMTIGDEPYGYGVRYKDDWWGKRYRWGSSEKKNAWEKLFHKYDEIDGNIKEVLGELLEYPDINDDKLDEIREEYITNCENKHAYGFRYYYVKYPEFRPGEYGIYLFTKDGKNIKQYEMIVLQTEYNYSSSAYQPYLKAGAGVVEYDELREGDDKISYNDGHLKCVSDGFLYEDNSGRTYNIRIHQNDGIDKVDRIKFLQKLYSEEINIFSLSEDDREEILEKIMVDIDKQ